MKWCDTELRECKCGGSDCFYKSIKKEETKQNIKAKSKEQKKKEREIVKQMKRK